MVGKSRAEDITTEVQLMGGSGSGSKSGSPNNSNRPRRVIRSDDLPNLPPETSAVEVWSTGLKVLQFLLTKRMSADVRIKLFDVGAKWLSSKPKETGKT